MTDTAAQHNVWLRVAANWTSVVLFMGGVASAGMFIIALSGRMGGLIAVAAVSTLVLFALGTLTTQSGRRHREAESTTVVYAPDFPAYVLDVDGVTGVRTRHLG